MEKGKQAEIITESLKTLNLKSSSSVLNSLRRPVEKNMPRSLVNLCVGILGQHFEDLIEDLSEIIANFPSHIKMALTAIARRRRLLNDDVIITLSDSSWSILDVAGSDVTDLGLMKVAQKCSHLRAADISQCGRITTRGVSELIRCCPSLEILRCGGCLRSDSTARCSLGIFKPKLQVMEEDSWEDLDTADISHGAQSLRWLIWPKIDDRSKDFLAVECPRIIINPIPSNFSYRGIKIPREADYDIPLDKYHVQGIDPKTWEVTQVVPRVTLPSVSEAPEIPIAEKFRLAFVERDARLAPKRAKNLRQHQRRTEKEWMLTNANAKAIALASQATKFLRHTN